MPNNNPSGVGGFKKGQSGNPGGLRNKHIGDYRGKRGDTRLWPSAPW